MNKPAKDYPPKILSFPQSLTGLKISGKKDILWPCHAYKISLPVKKKSALNIFEETILKLTEIETGNTKKLAKITYLDNELVSFIQNRLKDLNLVCERYEITEHGRELIKEGDDDFFENRECVSATVYIDLHSGNPLPFVNTESDIYEKIIKIDGDKIKFSTGTTGKGKLTRAWKIAPNNNSHWNSSPKSHDVIKVVRDFQKRYKQYSILHSNIVGYPPPIPKAQVITVYPSPELVYLHCKVVVQTGNPDFIVTDGFGFGFSEKFQNYLTVQNYKWLIDIKKKGVVDNLDNDSQDKAQHEVFGESINSYPKIKSYLDNVDKNILEAQELKVTSSNEESDLKNNIGYAIKSLYSALEWALRQLVFDNPVEHWEQIFANQNYRDNEKLICDFAEKIGFATQNQSILQVKKGAIKAIERGKVEMQPLLALSIAGAAHDNMHPLRNISDSEFISFLEKLKKLRDPIEHGNYDGFQISIKELKIFQERVQRIIKSLFPSFSTSSIAVNDTKEDINQLRLQARIKLDTYFGISLIQTINNNLREELLKLRLLEKNIEDNTQSFINSLASALQLSFWEAVSDRVSNYVDVDDLKAKAFERLQNANLVSNIPKPISTVNSKRISIAVQGINTTLGANFIALCLLYSERELKRLQSQNVVNLTAEIIELRGHGNRQNKSISKNYLLSLRDKVFNTIKNLMEV